MATPATGKEDPDTRFARAGITLHSVVMITPPPTATRRDWIALAVIALPCLLYSMDLTVLNLAVPSLSADLKPSSAQLLWIVDVYGFMVAGSLITMGTLGDRIGRRKLLMIGAAAFGAASIMAAFSRSAEMLIATRALLGVAGATLAPSTLSLIRNMFLDPKQRTTAIGIWASSYSVGGAIGPVLGGVMLEYFWWGSVFLLAVPVMVLLLVIGPKLLPEFRDEQAGRLDLASAAISLAAVLLVIYGLKRIAEDGVTMPALGAILGGVVLAVLFVRRQRRLADPLIDLTLFRSRAFTAALATYLLSIFGAFGTFMLTAQYLQLVLGLSPLRAGLWSVPSSLGFVAGSMLAPALVRRVRPATAIAGSLVMAAIGVAMYTRLGGAHTMTLFVVASLVFAIGVAVPVTLATDLIVGSATAERAGAASAISETGAELGGALGIAILGSIGTAIYRRAMATGVSSSVPSAAAEEARSTLGGAVAVADGLSGSASAELLTTARAAFDRSLDTVALIGAAVLLATAAMSIVALRRVERHE